MITGRPIVDGDAEGEALVTHEPLSFWGGYDFHTGEIMPELRLRSATSSRNT